jgi:hypothetical protein
MMLSLTNLVSKSHVRLADELPTTSSRPKPSEAITESRSRDIASPSLVLSCQDRFLAIPPSHLKGSCVWSVSLYLTGD